MDIELLEKIHELTDKLNQSIKLLAKYGNELASAERDYKIILRQEALKLRTEKNMAVTLINQIIYGVPEVANKRFKRDVAETMYKTAQENINVLKLNLKVIQQQLEMEWTRTGNNG